MPAQTSPATHRTPAAQTCEHCHHTGADVGPFVSSNDGSEFVLCSDRDACMVRQGLKPAPPRRPAPKGASLHQHPDGLIHALSSDCETVYTVTIGATPSCTCKAGSFGRRCYHIASAERQFAAFYRGPLRWHPSRSYTGVAAA